MTQTSSYQFRVLNIPAKVGNFRTLNYKEEVLFWMKARRFRLKAISSSHFALRPLFNSLQIKKAMATYKYFAYVLQCSGTPF